MVVLLIVAAVLSACGSNFEWFPKADTAPVANAGAAQKVFTGDLVLLDGSGSRSTSGKVINYSWSITSKPAGSAVTALTGVNTAQPSFSPDKAGDYIMSLTVNDGMESFPSTVTVTAFDSPPTANAGADQFVALNSTVTLDGSASVGLGLSYTWSFVSKPQGAGSDILISPTAVNPKFVPTVTGQYVIKLTVKDSKTNGVTSSDEVIINCNLGSVTVNW